MTMARRINRRGVFCHHPLLELATNAPFDIQFSSRVLRRQRCIAFAAPVQPDPRAQAQDPPPRAAHTLATERRPCPRLLPRSVLRDGQSSPTAPVSAVRRRSSGQRPERVRLRSLSDPERRNVMSAVHLCSLRLEHHAAGNVLTWPTTKISTRGRSTIELITDLRVGVPLQMHIHVSDVPDRVNSNGIKLVRGRAGSLIGEGDCCCVSCGAHRQAQDGAQ